MAAECFPSAMFVTLCVCNTVSYFPENDRIIVIHISIAIPQKSPFKPLGSTGH